MRTGVLVTLRALRLLSRTGGERSRATVARFSNTYTTFPCVPENNLWLYEIVFVRGEVICSHQVCSPPALHHSGSDIHPTSTSPNGTPHRPIQVLTLSGGSIWMTSLTILDLPVKHNFLPTKSSLSWSRFMEMPVGMNVRQAASDCPRRIINRVF